MGFSKFWGFPLLYIGVLVFSHGPAFGKDATTLIKECKTAADATAKVCDATKSTELTAAKASAGSLNQSLSSTSTNTGGATACGQMKNVSSQSAQALSKFKGNCKPKWEACVSACSKAETAIQQVAVSATLKKQFEASNKVCEEAAQEMASAESQMTSSQNQASASAQCQDDLGGGFQMPSFGGGESEPESIPEVTADSIPQDCSNPAMQGTEECSPRGKAHQVAVKSGNTSGFDGGPTMNSSDMPDIYSDYQQSSKSLPNQQAGGLKSLGSGGGAGGGKGGSESAFGKNDPYATTVKGGSAGGLGGQARGKSGSLAGGGGGGVTTVTSYTGDNDPQTPPMPDLRKFLPNGQRAPADTQANGGLHGPHANLFRQITSRYKQKYDELLAP